MHLRGRVAVVTGASRGGGRGIARVLGGEGATVYVTGRSTRDGGSPTGRPETVEQTADEVTERGGHGVPVRCDHTDDTQIVALFERVRAESGRLDLLVCNAWGGYELGMDYQPFWTLNPAQLDLMLVAGLRAHLLTVQRAGPLLTASRGGLVVLTSAPVGPEFHGHLYYDVVKTAINRIPVGLAADLRPYGVTALAVAPGWMHTERMDLTPSQAAQTESTEFVGRAIAALAADPDVARHSGSVRTVVELAAEYGFTDLDGRTMSEWWARYLHRPAR